MKKIMSFVAILCVLHVLAGGALAGYLFLTGHLDGSKVKVISDLARHQGTPDKLREKVEEILNPAPATASAPATQKGTGPFASDADALHAGTSAEDRLAFARAAMEQERIQLDRQAQELLHRQKLLDQNVALLDAERQKFEAQKKAFEPKATGAEDKTKADNFQKMLALYDELKPREVKDILAKTKDPANEELAASYLGAMDPSRAAKIISEFKTQEERDFLERVLTRIRTAGTTSASAPATGGDVAAAPPRP